MDSFNSASNDHGIVSADGERRNFCWERLPAAVVDGDCEAYAIYDDGRREQRECMALAR